MKNSIYILVLLISLWACKKEAPTPTGFLHEVSDGPKPWTSEIFEAAEPDFTFAIISDLTGGERPGIYSRAVTQLNLLEPTFVLSVGDLIEGGTEDTLQLKKEWDSFDARTSNLTMPFFHLGGNHDLTNPEMRSFWNKRYGPRYYHFRYRDVLFLMMDSEDYSEKRMYEIYQARDTALRVINGELEGIYEESTYYNMTERRLGSLGAEQLTYFQEVLEAQKDVRWIFLLMHKPLWLREDKNGLGGLEAILKDRNYTVFNGHFHSFSHRIRQGMEYFMLGTTGGAQNPEDPYAFDHISLVRMADKPVITHLKLEGILNNNGTLPMPTSLVEE